jgi:LysR family transcriptional regulator, nitrogen assimilation regulatory protein
MVHEMDINQIKTLIHVAELGSISKAADRLGIAQPALSRQIRLMEAELGAALFTRHGRGMILTDLGSQVLEPASEILMKLDYIRDLATSGRRAVSGRVRFGMAPTVAEIMTVPLACALRDQYPDVSLCIRSAFSGHLIEWLKRDEIDCLVSYDPNRNAGLRTVPVMIENLLLVGNSQCDLSLNQAVAFEDIAQIPLVLPSPMHGLRVIVDGCAAKAGVTLTPVIEADSFGSMLDLVLEGFGMTILPLGPINRLVQSGQLTAANLVEPTPSRQLVIAYPTDRPVSRATRTAGDVFAVVTKQLVEQRIWAGRVLAAGTPGSI